MAAEAEVSSVTNRAWNKAVISSTCELLRFQGGADKTAAEAEEGSSVTNKASDSSEA